MQQATTERQHTGSLYVKAANAEVEESEEGTTVKVPVSGFATDRDGDTFTENGIDSLVGQINEESIPMFPNHGLTEAGFHDYPFQQIMGRWEAAERDGDVVMAEATLREQDENADILLDLLSQDMPVGFSIGFGWDDDDAEEKQDGGYQFNDLDLMEISPVGIPSHPSAVVQAGYQVAAKMAQAGIDDPNGVTINFETNDMTEKDEAEEAIETEEEASDEDEEEEEQVDETEESEEKDADQAVDTANAIIGIYEGHMEAAREDVSQWLDSEFGEELSGNPDDVEVEEDYDDEEETEASDDEEDEDKVAELQSEIESLRAELETIRTDATTSSERKGGMEPVETDEVDEQTNGSGEVPPKDFARNLV